jgi:hypothetical protein
MPDSNPDWAYEYLLGKLGDVEDALAELDARAEPLTYTETRRQLVTLQARLAAAIAAFDEPAPTPH